MVLDTSKVNQKVNIAPGEVLFEEGSNSNSLNILHDGGISIEKKVGDLNISLLQTTGKNLTPGIISLFTTGRYPFTIKTTQESIVSTYAVTTATIKKTIFSKMSVGVMIAKSLLKEIIELGKKLNSIKSLSSNIEKLNDNLAITYYMLEASAFPDINPEAYYFDKEQEIQDPIMKLVRQTISDFLEGGGKIPETATTMFLNDNHQEWLRKAYAEEVDFDDKEFLFIRKILSTDQTVHNPLFEADITILIYMCEKLSGVYSKSLELLEEEVGNLHKYFDTLAGNSNSLVEKFYMILDIIETGVSDEKPEVVIPITELISEQIDKYLLNYRNIFIKDYQNLYNNFSSFQQKSHSMSQNLSPASDTSGSLAALDKPINAGIDINAMKKDLEGSVAKILNFVKALNQDQAKEFNTLLLKLKSMQNPLDPDTEARKVRKNVSKFYWEIYDSACVKYIKSGGSVPKHVEMMLKFGYMDERLLDVNHLTFLYTYTDPTENNYRAEIPTTFCQDWLQKIYDRKITTSIDELGETYFDRIKRESKDANYKRESDIPPDIDTSESRLKYEINAMYSPNVRLTTGNPATHLPILSRYHITIPLEKSIVTRKLIVDTIDSILAIDYTAFNREIVYNDEEIHIHKEMVQRAVIPDFLFVPSIGGRIMAWQPFSILKGMGSKESRGRIVLPVFVVGDLKTMLLEAIAAFRWELCKDILGPDWNNISIASITSEYTDYVQFFKKNKDLSIEVKEKLAAEFKRFRTDRDRFTHDYLQWIKFESEGVQRLNKVVRSIFYKHIPFKKDIRDKVSKLPAYGDMHNRFTNIRARQFKELEARYRKYQRPDGGYPPVLQENINFYKV